MEDVNTPKKPRSHLKILIVIIIIITLGLMIYFVFLGNISDARDDNVSLSRVKQLSQDKPLVLYFWGSGCPYCTDQKPIIEDLEDDYKALNVTFYWFDSSKHSDLVDHYDISGVPTTIVLNKLGVEEKFTGYSGYNEISDAIDASILTYS